MISRLNKPEEPFLGIVEMVTFEIVADPGFLLQTK
jgi:hypothetical protein